MAATLSSTCALPEGLRYYLLRSDAMGASTMVPLVPVDQLPFQLQGVPRQLTHRQISDAGWKLCCETNQAPSALSIQAPTATSFSPHPSSTMKPRYLAPDHHVRTEPQTILADYSRSPRVSHRPSAVVKSPELLRALPEGTPEGSSSLSDTFASIYQKDAQRLGYRIPHPSGIEPDPSKKEYCTHWIKTGECDWMAIGCKFKHEMPSIEKLRELGFVRGVPRWWKEKSAIVARPPTWMQRRLAGNDDVEQVDQMPEPRVFPDPATFRTRKAEGRDLLGEEVRQPRSLLKRGSSPKQTTAGRPTPSSAPVQEPIRRASHMSDLLIDLEDTRAPPPSPQLYHTSIASVESNETQTSSSRTSASPPSSPSLDPTAPLLINCKSPPKPTTKNMAEQEPNIQCHSHLSLPSDTEDDTPISTSPNAKSPRSTQTRRKPPPPPPRDNNRRPATVTTATTPAKSQPGLASSKHATSGNAAKDGIAKNTANRGRNNTSRNVNRKGGGEVGAQELYSKIEQLRRGAH